MPKDIVIQIECT